MRKRMKKILAGFLALVMVATSVQLGTVTTKAAEVSIRPGTPVLASQSGKVKTFSFDNVVANSDSIRSLSVQFITAIGSNDKIIFDGTKGSSAAKFTKLTNNTSADAHVVINAPAGATAQEWVDFIKNNIIVQVETENIEVAFIASEEEATSIIEYNYYNGHYYKVVQATDVTWKDALTQAESGKYLSAEANGYLATITSKEENDFIVSICQADSWLGATCDPAVTGKDSCFNESHKALDYYYACGPEKGLLMSSCKTTGAYAVPTDFVMGKYEDTVNPENSWDLTEFNNWAISDTVNQEPNFNYGTEMYLCMYKNPPLYPSWQVGGMWNDYANNTDCIDSYIIEYGGTGFAVNETESKQEVVVNATGNTITAKDFYVTKDEVSSLTPSDVKDLAHVTASNGSTTIDKADIAVDTSKIGTIKGEYDVTFSIGTGTEKIDKIVTATVVDNKTVDAVKDIAIFANDITIDKSLVTDTTDYVALGNAVGQKVSDGSPLTVTVDSKTVVAVAGDYTVTYKVTNGTESTTLTVAVHVTDSTTPTINAHDFLIPKEDVLTADKAKDYADVEGTKGGSSIPESDIVTELPGSIPTTPGSTYDVTFKTGNTDADESVIVTATVVDKVTTNPASKISIGANDFEIGKGQISDTELMKKLSDVIALNGDGTSRTDITVDASKVEGKKGIYPVTFTTRTGTNAASVTVNVTVKDSTDSTPATDQTKGNITANNFAIETGTSLTVDTAKELGMVSGKDKDGKPLDLSNVTVDEAQLAAINATSTAKKKGEMPLTFTSPEGEKVTITVAIKNTKDEQTVTGSDGKTDKTSIAANDFTVGKEDFAILTPDNIIKLSNAVATNENTGADVAITTVDTSKVQNAPGTYEVVLKTENGTATTIKVTISNDWKTVGNVDEASNTNKETDKSTVDNSTAVKADEPETVTNGEDKTYEKTNPSEIVVTVDPGKTVVSVMVNDKEVPKTDYTVVDGNVVFKDTAFSTYDNGVYTVKIGYSDNGYKEFKLTVSDYDANKIITKVPIFNMKKTIAVKSKFKLNLVGINKNAKIIFKSSKKKVASISKKGVITGKKKGKTTITANVIQKGSYYKVKIKLTVVKTIKIYNLKKKALSKKSGELPEFNVYKLVYKGSKTKLKFTKVDKNAVVTYKSKNKKIATVSKKGVIKGKKKGFTTVTATIKQKGKVYITRIFVRVDDGTKNTKIKKYLK